MTDSLSMYPASVPVLSRALANLRGILQKAETHAQAQNYDANVLLQTRLYPDMLPLVRQIQIVTDMAKFAAARLAGVTSPSYEDKETSFEELYARLDSVIAYLATFKPEQIDGSESREVIVPTRARGDMHFNGRDYLLGFVLPNIGFHSSIAYAILRSNGVPLGKLDYLGVN